MSLYIAGSWFAYGPKSTDVVFIVDSVYTATEKQEAIKTVKENGDHWSLYWANPGESFINWTEITGEDEKPMVELETGDFNIHDWVPGCACCHVDPSIAKVPALVDRGANVVLSGASVECG